MNERYLDFKKALRFEIFLVVTFTITFILYLGNLIPIEFRGQILGIVGFIGIVPVARSAFHSLTDKKVNVDLLATIALFFSFISAEWGSMIFINLMLTGARILDILARRRVRTSLESLIKMKPSVARVLRNREQYEIPLSEVIVGDLVVVNLGEQIPVDGQVLEGSATVNQASLTGESIPVLCEAGSSVLSATIVVSGNIIVRAERIGAATTFERMINLIEASHDAKTRIKTLTERFSSWYISIMLVASAILYFVTRDTRLVLAVVLVVCADDIAIAIPLAYIAGIGTAARQGIIVKGADFLERAAKITTLVVDKTGTLTLGKLVTQSAQGFRETSDKEMLLLASSLCARSTHPVSVAIREYAKEHGFSGKTVDNFKEIEGRGIIGTSNNGQELIIGRIEFLKEHGVLINDEVDSAVSRGINEGMNVTLLSLNGSVVGIFALADEIRPEVTSTIKSLKGSGITEIIMLTGDNEGVAKNIANRLGIEKYYSKLLPEHKVFVLKDYIGKKGRTVAMVGDGVNDAAVLALADVGIAMGTVGTDTAIESADVVLMNDDLRKVLELRLIAQKVLAVSRENFSIWGVVNALGLYLVFSGILHPSGAAAYNFLTDFFPIANSLRLFYYTK